MRCPGPKSDSIALLLRSHNHCLWTWIILVKHNEGRLFFQKNRSANCSIERDLPIGVGYYYLFAEYRQDLHTSPFGKGSYVWRVWFSGKICRDRLIQIFRGARMLVHWTNGSHQCSIRRFKIRFMIQDQVYKCKV